jgi:opacity protein-like surface antigen
MTSKRPFIVLTTACLLAIAQSSAAADWGPRVGLTGDPDQVMGGIQWNLGEVAPSVRAMPSAELGFGDDLLRFAGNLGIHYMFAGGSSRWSPYLGGELSFTYLSWDRPAGFRGDETDTELGVSIAGGVETRLSNGRILNLELRFGLDNVPDVQVHVGWIF